jgi:hypothetical protein
MRSLPRNRSRSVRTRGSNFQVLLATALTASLTLLASFQLESILDSESILEASMSSESGAQAVHPRFACKGCTARSGGRGEPTFFNDYKSAAVHYSCSSQCTQRVQSAFSISPPWVPWCHDWRSLANSIPPADLTTSFDICIIAFIGDAIFQKMPGQALLHEEFRTTAARRGQAGRGSSKRRVSEAARWHSGND